MSRGHSLQLIFETTKKAQLPDARANIGLHHWTHEEDGPPLITPNCVTIGEVRYQVKRLKQELDAIEAEATKKFRAYDKRAADWRRNYKASHDSQR